MRRPADLDLQPIKSNRPHLRLQQAAWRYRRGRDISPRILMAGELVRNLRRGLGLCAYAYGHVLQPFSAPQALTRPRRPVLAHEIVDVLGNYASDDKMMRRGSGPGVDVFRRGINPRRRRRRERALPDWPWRIRCRRSSVRRPVRDLGDRRNVHHVERRIGRAFEKHVGCSAASPSSTGRVEAVDHVDWIP